MINDVYGYECKSHIEKIIPRSIEREVEIRIPEYYEFEDIAIMLKHEQRHQNKDMSNFRKYSDEGRTLEETLEIFKENHDINHLDKDKFRRWLASLGWRQNDTK